MQPPKRRRQVKKTASQPVRGVIMVPFVRRAAAGALWQTAMRSHPLLSCAPSDTGRTQSVLAVAYRLIAPC